MPYRRERAGNFIQEELTLLLQRVVNDPRTQSLFITGVDLTRDRRVARVYVACYTGKEDLEQGLKGLESAKRFLKRELAGVLQWRFTPDLEFRVDHSWENGHRIEELFEQIEQEYGNSPEQDDQPE